MFSVLLVEINVMLRRRTSRITRIISCTSKVMTTRSALLPRAGEPLYPGATIALSGFGI